VKLAFPQTKWVAIVLTECVLLIALFAVHAAEAERPPTDREGFEIVRALGGFQKQVPDCGLAIGMVVSSVNSRYALVILQWARKTGACQKYRSNERLLLRRQGSERSLDGAVWKIVARTQRLFRCGLLPRPVQRDLLPPDLLSRDC
jgi:hypothetical protein